jgi:ADP-heptose:LPS heptosyltransferase
MNQTVSDTKAPRRVLLCRTDRLGDLILTLPCVALVKALFPGCKVDLLVSAYTAPAVKMYELADDVLEIGSSSGSLAKTLRSKGYDAAVAIFPEFRLARALAAARIPLRAGIAYRWYSRLFTYRHPEHRKLNLKHEAEYDLSLTYAAFAGEGQWEDLLPPEQLFPLAMNLPQEAVHKASGLVNAVAGEKVVALHPGGGGSASRWKPEYFSELAGRLSQRSDMRLVVTGGSGEETLCREIAQAGGLRAQNLCGKLTLPELAALYRRGNLLISNSTGPLHLARAVGATVLGLFPNQKGLSPSRWGPYGAPQMAMTAPAGGSLDCLEVLSVMKHALNLMGLDR